MSILEIQSITKAYRDHQALGGVSFDVPRGQIFGLLGPNGAGKTTLLRIINQIIQSDSGTILFDGETLAPRHIARIGYLPEERGLYKKMKVGEQLRYLGQLKGLTNKQINQKLGYWEERFEMGGWWQKTVSDLSKGMQQKVQFVSTVLHEPDLIILDEPFSGFDPVNADLIQQEILHFRDQGHTILFSTHRMESVEELCQDMVLINKGEVVLKGSKSEIKEQYRSYTYLLETDRPPTLEATQYKLLSQREENGRYLSEIQLLEGNSSESLLRALVGEVEVYGFQEKMPRIHEIFVRLVSQ